MSRVFVKFLIDHAGHYEECPSLFKAMSKMSRPISKIPSRPKSLDWTSTMISIPLLPLTGAFRQGDESVGGHGWEVNSWYKGKRQHSLASRLDAVVKFVVEKNVNRYLKWEIKFS
ncbi:hypothetical protein P885DRAFT_58516 [Corynascus similis CBS 632.67]